MAYFAGMSDRELVAYLAGIFDGRAGLASLRRRPMASISLLDTPYT